MDSSDDRWGVSDVPEPPKAKKASAEPDDALVGQDLLGKLRVVRLIAGGGMGAVYEVEHLLTGHRRALKVLRSKYLTVPASKERLMREAKVAGTLATPYVAETYDAGYLDDGSAYVLMELLEGRQLLDLFQEVGRVAISRVAGLMVQVCEGLAIAHEAGIVHRDLKPENIFLVRGEDGSERVKILDFGIAKFTHGWSDSPNRLTADGTILGTPYYMSPEQAAGEGIDHRTDIYSAGVIMYEGITGMLPFDGSGVGAVFAKIQLGEYVPLSALVPDADPTLAAVVGKAMHLEKAGRYPSAEAFREALLPFAPSTTVARGRTIPEGERRATLDYGSGKRDVAETMASLKPAPRSSPLPPPPRTPSTPTEMMVGSEPPAGAVEAPVPSSARDRVDGRRSRILATTTSRNRAVGLLAAAVLLGGGIGVGVVLWSDTGEPRERIAAPPEPEEREAASAEPAPAPPPAEPRVSADAGAAELESEVEASAEPEENVTMRASGTKMRRRTPAEEAGLVTNPYGL